MTTIVTYTKRPVQDESIEDYAEHAFKTMEIVSLAFDGQLVGGVIIHSKNATIVAPCVVFVKRLLDEVEVDWLGMVDKDLKYNFVNEEA